MLATPLQSFHSTAANSIALSPGAVSISQVAGTATPTSTSGGVHTQQLHSLRSTLLSGNVSTLLSSDGLLFGGGGANLNFLPVRPGILNPGATSGLNFSPALPVLQLFELQNSELSSWIRNQFNLGSQSDLHFGRSNLSSQIFRTNYVDLSDIPISVALTGQALVFADGVFSSLDHLLTLIDYRPAVGLNGFFREMGLIVPDRILEFAVKLRVFLERLSRTTESDQLAYPYEDPREDQGKRQRTRGTHRAGKFAARLKQLIKKLYTDLIALLSLPQ